MLGLISFLPVFLRGVAIVPSLVQGVEALFGAKSGSDKKQAVLEIAGAAINVVDLVAQKQVLDADGFTSGLGQIVDGVVKCMNASVWHKGQG